MRLAYFPDPRPDELLYSICARFVDHVGLTNPWQVARCLFGRHDIAPIVNFPSNIDSLIEHLPAGHCYTAEDIIQNHTLLPLLRPFLLSSRYEQIFDSMRKEGGNKTYSRLGLGSSRVPLLKWLRFCPNCIEADRKQYGQCYWHRIHQVSGVDICPKHLVLLENSKVYVQSSTLNNTFVSAEIAVGRVESRSQHSMAHFQIMHRIAIDMEALLNNNFGFLDTNELQNRYLSLFADKGLITTTNNIRSSDLLSLFNAYYPFDLLKHFNSETDNVRRKFASWPVRLVRDITRLQNPLCHLLLMHFLGLTAHEFFQITLLDTPFGNGPWPCLNATCECYRMPVITKCHIIRRRGQPPIGNFSCTCGFVYSRSGPDISGDDIYKIGKVLERGELWKSVLRELFLEPTISYPWAAHKLGVSVNKVKHLLSLYQPELLAKRMGEGFDKVKRHYHEQWTQTFADFPQANFVEIKQKVPMVYRWLYNNDACWLQAHSPSLKKKVLATAKLQPLKPIRPAVDWQQRDEETAQLVRNIAENLRRLPQRPKRITKAAICKEGRLPFLAQSSSIEKMPLTRQALLEVSETYLDVALRRIEWVFEQYYSKQTCPERWRFIRDAYLKEFLHEPLVQKALEGALTRLLSFRDARCFVAQKVQRKLLPTDVSDETWERVSSCIPGAKPGGRPRSVNIREVLNIISFVERTKCSWSSVPDIFEVNISTARHYRLVWHRSGILETIKLYLI